MTQEKLLSQHPLANGLTLEFWDLSRHVAGDRWQVVVRARVIMPVNQETIPPELGERLPEVVSALGSELAFVKDEVRNFIDAREKDRLSHQLQEQLLSSLKTYLGHPEFAQRLIRRKFAEYQEKSRWYQETG